MSSTPSATESVPQSSFEQELHRLQDIVGQLERGELSLEATIAAFQQGSELVARCQRLIADAELRITKLADASSPVGDGPIDHTTGELLRQLPGL